MEDTSNDYKKGDFAYVNKDNEYGAQYIGCLVRIDSIDRDHYECVIVSDCNDDNWDFYDDNGLFLSDFELDDTRTALWILEEDDDSMPF